MASFITGLQKSKKHSITKDATENDAKKDDDDDAKTSEQSLTGEELKQENSLLQKKIEKNVKLMQQLSQQYGEHEAQLKAKDLAKKHNLELTAEHTRLMATSRQLNEKFQAKYGQEVETKTKIIKNLEQETNQLKQDCAELEDGIRKVEAENAGGQAYYNSDKYILEQLLAQQKDKLDSAVHKLERLQSARHGRTHVYNSVEDFMNERAEVIDLAMQRGQLIQAQQEQNFKLEKMVRELEKHADELTKQLQRLSKR